MTTNPYALRHQIRVTGEKLYRCGFIPATDGNISHRISDNTILITTCGTRKGDLTDDDIVSFNLDSEPAASSRLSSEWRLHRRVYQLRQDVNAVIHAHPPLAVACSLAGVSLVDIILPEQAMTLGAVPTAPYALPSSPLCADSITDLIRRHDAIILERHGAVTAGRTLDEAFDKMERLEYVANVLIHARLLGRVAPLTDDQIDQLHRNSGSINSNSKHD